MKNIILFFLGGVLFLSSCSSPHGFMQNIESIQGETVKMECIVGIPHGIVSTDSILFFYDRYDGKAVTIYDIKNNKDIGRVISIGEGPGEVVTPLRNLCAFQNKLYAFESQTGNMLIFNILDTILLEQKIQFNERPLELRKMQNYYVGTSFENSRYSLYNLDGVFLQSVGNFPFNENTSAPNMSFLYQGQLCTYPGKNYFALGSLLCDNIEFFEVTDNHCTLLKRYETYNINAKWEDNRLNIDENCIINYTQSYGTEKYCYMLYSGKTYKDNKDPIFGQYIVAFEWNGNHHKTYELDVPITSFCVDDKYIYATAYQDTGFSIMRFKLK